MTDNDDHDNDRHNIAEEDASVAHNISLRAEADYYVEDGLMVFTAHFLRQRGYCCESGCRHCPYGYVVGKA